MKHIFAFLTLISFSAFLTAQSLTITNGNKVKELKVGSFLDLELLLNSEITKEKCCPDAFGEGTLTKVSGDSLYFSLRRFIEIETSSGVDFSTTIQFKNKEEMIFRAFAKEEIFSLRYYKNSKKRKASGTRASVGGVLSVLGIGAAVGALFVKDKDSRKRLLLGAGGQFVSGFIIGLSSVHKKYSFHKEKGEEGDIWKFKD